MSDAFEQQEWVKFGVAATLSKQYAADQRMFLDLLAQMLEGALPGEVEIGRKGGLRQEDRAARHRYDRRFPIHAGRSRSGTPGSDANTHCARHRTEDRNDPC